MLELRPSCEHCNKALPPNSMQAMICSYECTYCKDCAIDLFQDVCPSCGGNFHQRPIRPKEELKANPASTKVVHKPKDLEEFKKMLNQNRHIHPKYR